MEEAVVFIQGVYNITGIGPIPVGNVKSGTLKIGMKLNVNGVVREVKGIEMHHQKIQEAHVGDNVGISFVAANYDTLQNVTH